MSRNNKKTRSIINFNTLLKAIQLNAANGNYVCNYMRNLLVPHFATLIFVCSLVSGCATTIDSGSVDSNNAVHSNNASLDNAAVANIGDSHQEDSNIVTSLSASPYGEPPQAIKMPVSEIALDLKSFETTKVDQLQYSGKMFFLHTADHNKLFVTIGNNGRIIGIPDDVDVDTRYILGTIDKGAELVDFNGVKGLLAYKNDSNIKIYSLSERRVLAVLDRLSTRITTLKFSPDGETLLIGGADSMIYNWRFKAELGKEEKNSPEKLLHRYAGSGSVISALAYHPEGRVFFSGDWRGDLAGWQRYGTDKYEGRYEKNVSDNRFFTGRALRVRSRVGEGIGIDLIEVDPTGNYLFLALQDGSVEVWKIKGMRRVALTKVHDGPIFNLSLFGNGGLFATTGKDGRVKVWQLVSEDSIVEESIDRGLKKNKRGEKNKAVNKDIKTEVADSLQEEKDRTSAAKEPELVKRLVTTYQILNIKDIHMPGVITANFDDTINLIAGDSKGELMQITLADIVKE